jgi:transcriptional regulator with PAS, ATPase and Fis domain
VVPILDRDVPAPHLFAAYGPHDYELLLFELTQEDAAQLIDTVRRSLAALDSQPSAAIAWYPRDGRTADALLARANALVRPKAESSAPNIVLPAEPASAMAQVLEFARRAAKGTINILILGETGVGKEVMAQAIHRQSPRANGRLLPLNCAGLSEGLLESELFGYEKGAFTGAVQAKVGLLEAASGGTIFLDEVGEMTLPVQARVLRAIANREILPLGALKPRPIDVRLIAATNRDLVAEVAKGRFRRDLYYRLNGISLKIPPLRERRTEIPALAATFLVEHARDLGRAAPTLSAASRNLIERHEWRGNIRELKNVIERALLLCEGEVIHPEHLSLESDGATAFAEVEATEQTRVRDLTYEQEDERRVILEILKANVWNQSRAARALGMPRRTLIAKLDRYRIPRPQKGAQPSLPDDDDDEAS